MAAIPDDERSELEASGFLVDADLDEVSMAHARYMDSKHSNALLSITVELTQSCNLACTYCYQNSYRKPGKLSGDITEKLGAYVTSVVESGKRPITDVVLRFIGGEPLIQKKKVLLTIFEMRQLAVSLNLNLHVQIDTNGLLLDESVIRELDVISVTLTNRADHDRVRVRHNGAGSYDLIVKRLIKHAEHFNKYKTLLSVRFNANAFNAKYVPDVYRMVTRLGVNDTEFELYNTVNYDYNLLVPTLNKEQYKKLYLDMIKLKFEHGEVIKDFPRPTFATCAAYTPYNLKVTAEGSLALCDAFHSPVGSIDRSRVRTARSTLTRRSSPDTSSTTRSRIINAEAARISASAEGSTSANQIHMPILTRVIFSSLTWTKFCGFSPTPTLSHQADFVSIQDEITRDHQWFFCARASNRKTAAEIDTFSESVAPSIGMNTRS